MSGRFGFACVAPLFVPADRPERFEKAARSGADAVILDLEDAVAASAKLRARDNLRADFTDLPVFVRVNAVGTPWHEADLAVAESLPIAGVMLPKAAYTLCLSNFTTRHRLIALIESAAGIAEARAVAANPLVDRLAFGSIDYCADLGCSHERDVLLSARCELVLASRIAEIAAPLDGVTAAFDDVDRAVDDARHAAKLGFAGKLCIHPKQAPAVLAGMRPLASEIAWAEQISAADDGVAAINQEMIDKPVRTRAWNIMARATGEGSA